jgi:hypothetical protein
VDTTPTRVLTSVADTKISNNAPTTKYGASSSMGADGDEPNNSGKDVYSLLRWDLSTLPPGAKILSASVTLNVTVPSAETYEAYQLKQPWVEGVATWNIYATGKRWQIAGARGLLDRAAEASGAIAPSVKGKQTFSLSPALVQSWMDNIASNQGIILADGANTDGFSFSSGEAPISDQRPQLNVTYTSP